MKLAGKLAVLLLLRLGGVIASAQQQQQQHGINVLRSASEVRLLSLERLAMSPPVELEAIVLYRQAADFPNFMVHENGTAIYINVTNSRPPEEWRGLRQICNDLREGDLVRVKGHAKAGNFDPVVVPTAIERVGTAPLPEPEAITAAELSSGRLDGQWVVLSGVVQAILPRDGKNRPWGLELASAEGNFRAVTMTEPATGLLGARVRLRGLCLPVFNISGQLIRLQLHLVREGDLTVVDPAPGDPFSVPEITISRMRPFDAARGADTIRHRVKGTVIFAKAGSHLYLQENNWGVRIGLLPGQTAVEGDLVEASGFVRMRGGYAEMTHAVVRTLSASVMPEPLVVDSARFLSGAFYATVPSPLDVNGRLVALRGTLIKADHDPDGKETFWVETPGTPSMNVPVTVPPGMRVPRLGSLVEARGVCELLMSEDEISGGLNSPVGMKVSLSRSRDLRVLESAPFWTPARIWLLTGGIAAGFALTLLQVRSLRHRVRVGAAALAEALLSRRAADARIEERQRLSEEVHDIMAQSLTGVSLQLAAAEMARTSRPEAVPHHLKLASGLLELARDEIRRTLRDLHSSLLENGDLTGALKRLAEMFTKSGACEVDWEIHGTPPHVHPLTAHSLLRVTQESLTNSLKHGQATRIVITVDYSETAVSLTIQDNGNGADATRPGPAEGHFGLENMRGRMRRLGGDFKFTSTPGHGATVEVHIPITPASQKKDPGEPS